MAEYMGHVAGGLKALLSEAKRNGSLEGRLQRLLNDGGGIPG